MIKARVQLLELLGSKCKVCGESDIETLQIDHIADDGAEDRRRFKGLVQMYIYYINRPEEANEKLQVLCGNHNWKKRYAIHTKKKILEQQEEQEKEKPNKFFDWEKIDDVNTPLWKQDRSWESPCWLGCPNCHVSNWSILVAYGMEDRFDFGSNEVMSIKKIKKQHFYLTCNNCHYDILCGSGMNQKPPHIQTAESDYYQSLSETTSS